MDEKIKYILDSVKLGISGRKIDKLGKGNSVTKLRRGEKVGKQKIDEMYKKAKVLRRSDFDGLIIMSDQELKDMLEKFETFKSHVVENQRVIRSRIIEIMDENKELKREQELGNKRIEELERKIEQLGNKNGNGVGNNLGNKSNSDRLGNNLGNNLGSNLGNNLGNSAGNNLGNKKINGWSIITKNIKQGGRTYQKIYAKKYIDKKQHTVYVGSDTSKAQDKINAYLAKKGIENK